MSPNRWDDPTWQIGEWAGSRADVLHRAKIESGEIADPDTFLHAFHTLFGMPPEKGDAPACGAVLTEAYDFPQIQRQPCPDCQALVEAQS